MSREKFFMGECVNLIKILFVCHGNICRSPMAEFIMKYLVKESGNEEKFFIESAATTNDEIGNDIYPNAKSELKKNSIPFERRQARKIKRSDYSKWDYIICMDNENLDDILYIMGGDEDNKVKLLLDFTGEHKEVSDPWYTRNFALAYSEIYRGCKALLKHLES
ncbi:MAG: low molecular weight phosphotyrosine protein phosphatase [Synergistaceae bacterium]|nr:low molecular weight phosphotyrosine protein phosphatase [Synergistaceae bacterium]